MPRGTYFTSTTLVDAAQNTDIVLAQVSLTFYNKNKLKQLSQETQKEYQYIVNSFMRWAGEDTILSSISPVTANINSMKELSQYQWQPL